MPRIALSLTGILLLVAPVALADTKFPHKEVCEFVVEGNYAQFTPANREAERPEAGLVRRTSRSALKAVFLDRELDRMLERNSLPAPRLELRERLPYPTSISTTVPELAESLEWALKDLLGVEFSVIPMRAIVERFHRAMYAEAAARIFGDVPARDLDVPRWKTLQRRLREMEDVPFFPNFASLKHYLELSDGNPILSNATVRMIGSLDFFMNRGARMRPTNYQPEDIGNHRSNLNLDSNRAAPDESALEIAARSIDARTELELFRFTVGDATFSYRAKVDFHYVVLANGEIKILSRLLNFPRPLNQEVMDLNDGEVQISLVRVKTNRK